MIRRLTPALRKELKSPLGLLIRGSSEGTMGKLRKLIGREGPLRIISVGDVVSDTMVRHNILPHILVVDNRVLREPISPIHADVSQTLWVKNPPGTLTDEAWVAMREAMRQVERTKIVVDGEEDLLTLVAVLCAPENSFVVYGQPHEGVVVIKVTKQERENARRIVEAMETVASKG